MGRPRVRFPRTTRRRLRSLGSVSFKPIWMGGRSSLAKWNKQSKKSKTLISKVLLIILAVYLVASVYNGSQEDKVAKVVNDFSQKTLGYDVLVDKGVIGHSWLHFIHPSANFSALSRNTETRLSYAIYTGLGVWDLPSSPNSESRELDANNNYVVIAFVGAIVLSFICFAAYMLYKNQTKTSSAKIIKLKANPQVKSFDLMTGHEFEHFCAYLLKKNGYERVKVTRGSGDNGVDILARKNKTKYAIQCKCYSSNIGNKAVQEVFTGKTFYKCDIGIVMTNRYFTQSAKETAKKTEIILWDRDKIEKMSVDQK